MINSDAWEYPQATSIIEKSAWRCYVNIFPQFRTNVSLLESFFRILPALSAKIDDTFGCMGVPSNNHNFGIEVQGYTMLIFLPQFRTNVSLFESVICLVPRELWNSLEARMLFDKCIEN